MKDLSIIIPAKDEGWVISNTLLEVEKTFSNPLNLDYEIIVVDDGSIDDTYSKAKRVAIGNERIKVVWKENGGKGSALKYGFNFCKGENIAFLDADLDLHPRQIHLFIDYMNRFDADVIVGSKRHPLSKINYPFIRKILSNSYYLLTKVLFNLDIKDTQTGLKLFKRKVLEEIFPRVLCKKHAFDLELLVNANYRGYKIVEVPVELNFQRIASRIKLKEIFYIFIDTLAIFYRLRILRYYDGSGNKHAEISPK